MAAWTTIASRAVLAGVSLLFLAAPPQGRGADGSGAKTIVTKTEPATASTGGVEGVATYYGKRHRGRRTTSGEKYHPEKFTAAHARLPLGSKVRVRNLENGKEVVVEVNDRCRKRRFNAIDLSRAAARELDFLKKGRVKVRIERLESDRVVASRTAPP